MDLISSLMERRPCGAVIARHGTLSLGFDAWRRPVAVFATGRRPRPQGRDARATLVLRGCGYRVARGVLCLVHKRYRQPRSSRHSLVPAGCAKQDDKRTRTKRGMSTTHPPAIDMQRGTYGTAYPSVRLCLTGRISIHTLM